MLIGVLGAFAQPTIRRLLSFHIISQIGYMLMGLAVALSPSPFGPGFGLALAILFLVHNQLVKTALLMSGGQVELETGTGKYPNWAGWQASRPVQATLSSLSPPLRWPVFRPPAALSPSWGCCKPPLPAATTGSPASACL
jgi:multicomponent Na+:H+ antiporter subunit D